LTKGAGFVPRFFVAALAFAERPATKASRAEARACYISIQMALDCTSMACRRVVIDDHARLPGRFFGRFATSATSELARAS
jgi:hypothetical protein